MPCCATGWWFFWPGNHKQLAATYPSILHWPSMGLLWREWAATRFISEDQQTYIAFKESPAAPLFPPPTKKSHCLSPHHVHLLPWVGGDWGSLSEDQQTERTVRWLNSLQACPTNSVLHSPWSHVTQSLHHVSHRNLYTGTNHFTLRARATSITDTCHSLFIWTIHCTHFTHLFPYIPFIVLYFIFYIVYTSVLCIWSNWLIKLTLTFGSAMTFTREFSHHCMCMLGIYCISGWGHIRYVEKPLKVHWVS